MLHGQRIFVVIPSYNSGDLLEAVLASVPAFVDGCIVVDDGSCPETMPADDGRTIVIRHSRNRGVGAAIISGYAEAARRGADVAAVMAADNQMDPADLPALLEPVLSGQAVYCKGDRLSHPECRNRMPVVRYIGNCCLTFLTRVVTGLPTLMDSQCGYTALRLDVLPGIPVRWLYPRYGFPHDLLAALAGAGCPVAQVVVAPVYRGERSCIRPIVAVLVYPWILVRGILVRMISRCGGLRRAREAVRLQRARAGV